MRSTSRLLQRLFSRATARGQLPVGGGAGGGAPGAGGGGGGGSWSDELPADSGALFDLNARFGIADQIGGLVITNAGGLAVGTDDVRALNEISGIEYDATNLLQTVGTPITGHSAALPYTVYAALRLSELDGSNASMLSCFVSDADDDAVAQFVGDEIRVRVRAGGSWAYKDSVALNFPGQAVYVIAVTYLSLSQCKVYIEGVTAGGAVNLSSSRDPSDFTHLLIGGFTGPTTTLRGSLFRYVVAAGDRNAEIAAVLTSAYTPLWTAGQDLSEATGTVAFDWRPSKTGDHSNARDSTGSRLLPQIVSGYGGPGTTDGFAHLKPTAASDEMLTFDYPGVADINAVGEPAPQRILLMAAFKGSGSGEQDLISVGTNVAGTSRIWLRYNADTGVVTAGYRDAGGTEHTLSSTGGVVLSRAAVACAEFAQTGGGTVTQVIVGIPGVGTVTLNGSALGDVTFDKVVLAGQYSAQTTLTADAALLGAVVIESQDYTEALALEFLNSVRTVAESSLVYLGPESSSLIGWWSASDPLVSAEGNNYPTTVFGSPASELGTYGGRAYHQAASDANGYKVPMNTRQLPDGEVLTAFVLWRNPTTGGSTASDRLGGLFGALTSERPTLHCSINYTFKQAQGGIINDVGIANLDSLASPIWAHDSVHVTMSRITKAADGLSYSQSVGLDGTIDGSPSSRTSTDLVGFFNAFGPGNPGFSNHSNGDQIFDVFIYEGVVDYAAIFTHIAGLVTP